MSDSLRRLAAQIVGIKRDVLQLQTAPRAGQTSIEHGGGIDVINPATGEVTARLGTQEDGTYGSVTLDGPIPPAPSAPILDVAPGLVAVTWDGTHSEDAATPLDFQAVEIYVAPEPFAFIEEGTLSGSLVGSDGDRITVALAPGVWHVGLVTVSQAMKRSRLSSLAIATVSALPSEQDVALAGGRVTISDDEPEVADAEGKPDSALWQQVVDDALVGAWRLDAAVPEWRPIEVAPGTPYMPKIDLGSATVGLLTGARLAADAIDGKTITGATFRTGPNVGPVIGGQGVMLDSDGLSAFNTAGVRTVNINADTGVAELTGGLRTAESGSRVVVEQQSEGSYGGLVGFYTGENLRGELWVSGDFLMMRANRISVEHKGLDGVVTRSGVHISESGSNLTGPTTGARVAVNSSGASLEASATTTALVRAHTWATGESEPTRPPGAVMFQTRAGARYLDINAVWWRWQRRALPAVGEWVVDEASNLWTGPVKLATAAQTIAGTDAARVVTPAALASWRDSHFYLATKTTSQPGISSTPVQIAGLTLSAPRAGRARIQISCTSKSSASDDLVAYEIRVNGVKIKRGTQLANSSGTGRGHLLEMTAITTIATGGAITVWAERPVGSGAVEIDASPADPCTLTLEYV